MTGQRTPTPLDHAATHVVRAAVMAPSLHNSQPWLFSYSGGRVLLYADGARRLPLADAHGRQQVISCGAALFNLRLAMRYLGFQPMVRPFPDARMPALLVRVGWGAYARAAPAERLMHHAMRERHTHRGPFHAAPPPAPLVQALRQQARAEGAELCTMDDLTSRSRLAELVHEAERLRRLSPAYVCELRSWTRMGHDSRDDGVLAAACDYHPDCTALAGRDFNGVTRHPETASPPEKWRTRTGIVALLTTPHDACPDWLRAGQALQRVLLYATGHKITAAFHTQPLEIADLRAQVRAVVPSGQYPQMLLRLGYTHDRVRTPRRPVTDVLARGTDDMRPITCAAPPPPDTQHGAEPRG